MRRTTIHTHAKIDTQITISLTIVHPVSFEESSTEHAFEGSFGVEIRNNRPTIISGRLTHARGIVGDPNTLTLLQGSWAF